ncbi:MAG: hypothetical protein AAF718_02490 [Pseudomonadota bacterium]
MLERAWKWLRQMLSGQRLSAAIQRNERAADELDDVLREVLKR